ncbi:hypothetical protein ACTZWT_15630 [Rhodopseudomonas sp. NSM]|uniref:hypothetical protein n=1 Tax=Rhodopseudomonas sp. NSM TaxID=3457630 RepID=UPI0040352825
MVEHETITGNAPSGAATEKFPPAGRACQFGQPEQVRLEGAAATCARQSARPDETPPAPSTRQGDGSSEQFDHSAPDVADPVGKPRAPDTLSRNGAMALAKRLEKFWHDKGYPTARFWAEPIAERFEKVGTYEIHRVVCNLVNGMPPRYRDDPPRRR